MSGRRAAYSGPIRQHGILRLMSGVQTGYRLENIVCVVSVQRAISNGQSIAFYYVHITYNIPLLWQI